MNKITLHSLVLSAATLFLSLAAFAQNGTQMRCESIGSQTQRCYVNGPIADVRVNQVLSHASCNQGSTWGWDSQSVWVSQGCRAIFDVLYGFNSGPISGGNFQDVTCQSQGQSNERCDTHFHSVYSIQLIKQKSHDPCIQGQSFGLINDDVWVSRGCRGVFRVWGN